MSAQQSDDDDPDRAEVDALAASLRGLPDDAVVSGLAAARLLGLWLPPGALQGRPEITVPGRGSPPRQRAHTRSPDVRHRRRDLRPDETMLVDGIATTTPARTWLDLSEVLTPADLVAVGDCVLRLGTAPEELAELVGRARHRRGVRRAKHVLPLLNPRAESRPESCLRYGMFTYGLPAPEVNIDVVVDGEWVGRPDLRYEKARLGIEYQGEHHAKVDQRRHDISRELRFGEFDWLLLEAGPEQVFHCPERFLRRIAFELSRRGGV